MYCLCVCLGRSLRYKNSEIYIPNTQTLNKHSKIFGKIGGSGNKLMAKLINWGGAGVGENISSKEEGDGFNYVTVTMYADFEQKLPWRALEKISQSWVLTEGGRQ